MPVDLYSLKDDEGGVWSSLQLTKTAIAHPKVMYRDKLLTMDLYRIDDHLMLNLYCPKCEHSLRVETTRKKIEWDEESGLFVEPFRCTWEMDERNGERIQFGLNLCRWTVGIEAVNRTIDTSEGHTRIHGIAKDA